MIAFGLHGIGLPIESIIVLTLSRISSGLHKRDEYHCSVFVCVHMLQLFDILALRYVGFALESDFLEESISSYFILFLSHQHARR